MRKVRPQAHSGVKAVGRRRKVQNFVETMVVNTEGMISSMPKRDIYDSKRFPYIAEVLCRSYGATQEQLAPIFGVSKKCIEKWSAQHPEFREAMRMGRDVFDSQQVENALLKRALGYQFTEISTKTVQVKAKHKYDNYNLMVPAIETITTIKEIPPDVKAIMFWLTNRNAERWKMVTTVNANIKAETTKVQKKLDVKADLSKMDSNQLRALKEMVQNQGQIIHADTFEENDQDTQQLLEEAQTILDANYEEDGV